MGDAIEQGILALLGAALDRPCLSDSQERLSCKFPCSRKGFFMDIQTLETWLWDAACVIRGPLDEWTDR